MEKYFYIVICVLLLGCAPHFNPCWPLPEQPDTFYKYACSRLSKECHLCLSENGYNSYIVIGTLNNGEGHSWIEIIKGGQVWWLDPLHNKCFKKDQWFDRKPMTKYKVNEKGIVDWEIYR